MDTKSTASPVDNLSQHSVVSRLIRAPAATIFAYVGNPHRFNEYSTLPLEVQEISPGPVGVGSTWKQVGTLVGIKGKANLRVVRYEPPHLVICEVSGPVKGKIVTHLEPRPSQGQSTLVTVTWDYEVTWMPPVGGSIYCKMLHLAINKAGQESLVRLQKLIET